MQAAPASCIPYPRTWTPTFSGRRACPNVTPAVESDLKPQSFYILNIPKWLPICCAGFPPI